MEATGWAVCYSAADVSESCVSMFSMDSDIIMAAELSLKEQMDDQVSEKPSRQTESVEQSDRIDAMDRMVQGWESDKCPNVCL